MKKITIIAAGLASASIAIFSGCAKQKKVVEFDVPYTIDFTVPSSSVTVNLQRDFPVPSFTTNIGKWLDDNTTHSDLIGNITCTKCILSVVSPTTQSLNFLKELHFLINAGKQEEQQQAFKWITVPQSSTLTTLDMSSSYTGSSNDAKGVNDINAKNYCIEPDFHMTARLTPSTTISSNVVLRVSCTYHVKGIDSK